MPFEAPKLSSLRPWSLKELIAAVQWLDIEHGVLLSFSDVEVLDPATISLPTEGFHAPWLVLSAIWT